MMLRRFFIAAIMLIFANNCFAAPAGNTSDPKVPYGPGISNMAASGFGPFKVSFDASGVIDRDLRGNDDVMEAEFSGQEYMVRIGYTFADRIEPYIRLGGSRFKVTWKENDRDIKVNTEYGMVSGIGTKALVFEIPEHRIRFTMDGQYLYTNPEVRRVGVDMPDRTVSAAEFQLAEWQLAGVVSMEFPFNYDRKDSAAIYSLIPYIGVAYADSTTDTHFRWQGTDFDIGNAKAKDKYLLITGCDMTSPENVSLNAEARWIGETAASGGMTVKF